VVEEGAGLEEDHGEEEAAEIMLANRPAVKLRETAQMAQMIGKLVTPPIATVNSSAAMRSKSDRCSLFMT